MSLDLPILPLELEQAVALDASIGFDAPDFEDPPVPMKADAAVLILVNITGSPSITLTLRQAHLRKHAGQISFPGGRRDEGDASLWHTARREAMEEIGLPFEHPLREIGALPVQKVISGFRVTPFLAINEQPFEYIRQAEEVAEVFELPLARLRSTDFARSHYEYNGQPRYFHVLQYENYRIWGATARILFNLTNRIEYVRARS